MNEYLILYSITGSDTVYYYNTVYKAKSKKEAYLAFKKEHNNAIHNIICLTDEQPEDNIKTI